LPTDKAILGAEEFAVLREWYRELLASRPKLQAVFDSHLAVSEALREAEARIDRLQRDVGRLMCEAGVEVEKEKRLEVLEAALRKAEICTTCGGSPHPSGKVCVCGGTGDRSRETIGLREAFFAAEARIVALEETLVAIKAAINDPDCISDYAFPAINLAIEKALAQSRAAESLGTDAKKQLPTIEEMSGLVEDLTGGKTLKEHMDDIRGEQRGER
jgi:hypothetical protein